ncbi:MAG TPA: 3-methyl-2-oxobutanoate hydroxymethyltransferase [Burkholderiales bacterium]|nr:3-methyl-2-oxobutanoate hydroxymethyltransferase [Burkholderiales bacterium]HXZ91349.1 3-methyl-2-oxobutanoate hydroxymethyltransferase [Burkholderiales bacterium]
MKHTAESLRRMKSVTRIPMLTAYTAPVARCLEQAGIPVILVGDSVGMVEMGFDSTRRVTVEQMQYHIGAVRRGARDTHVVGDLPYDSDRDPDAALRSARLLIEAGADSVKLEGPKYDAIRHLVANGIDVVGHTGLTPQTSTSFKQVGREAADAKRVLNDAVGISAAGAFMIVLEHIPEALGAAITGSVAVPTIGIGAGKACDGQVLVINDALGLSERLPPFARRYADLGKAIVEAARDFAGQVEGGSF